MLRFPEMWSLADCCSAGHLTVPVCSLASTQLSNSMKVNASTRAAEGDWAQRLCSMGTVVPRQRGKGWAWQLRGRRTLQNRTAFRTVQLARVMLWGLQASLQLSTKSRLGKEALCLPVTTWKCLTLCLQNWVVGLDTRKLHRFSDGMLLCSLYHLVFNFFPRVMGQWLESNIATSSCLW